MSDRQQGRSRRAVLIVEDDRLWQEILKENLEDEGYDVVVVDKYQEARQALEDHPFALVILDLKLAESSAGFDKSAPMFDGERLLAHISQRYPDTPCIVVSGEGTTEFVRDAFKEYHVVDYIEKSGFDIPTFLELTNAATRSATEPGDLRRTLDDKFSLDDIKDLCFDLDIDFEDLPGDGKKAREVVAHCRRTERLEELEKRMRTLRPGIL